MPFRLNGEAIDASAGAQFTIVGGACILVAGAADEGSVIVVAATDWPDPPVPAIASPHAALHHVRHRFDLRVAPAPVPRPATWPASDRHRGGARQ